MNLEIIIKEKNGQGVAHFQLHASISKKTKQVGINIRYTSISQNIERARLYQLLQGKWHDGVRTSAGGKIQIMTSGGIQLDVLDGGKGAVVFLRGASDYETQKPVSTTVNYTGTLANEKDIAMFYETITEAFQNWSAENDFLFIVNNDFTKIMKPKLYGKPVAKGLWK